MIRILFYIIYIISFLNFVANAQVQLSPVLVGSAGGFYSFTDGSISASAGEAVILTINNSNTYLTQGFHQPFSSARAFTITVNKTNSTCNGADNGSLKVITEGGVPPFSYQYEYISVDSGNIILPNISDSIDSIFNLKPGNYIVTVSDFYNRIQKDTINIGIEYEGACKLKIYSGFSPNGDGVNDIWIIDGIEFYPENSVYIYNRWGNIVWSSQGYDNQSKVWDGRWNLTGEPLVNGTYFYLINIPNMQFKGWVELTK